MTMNRFRFIFLVIGLAIMFYFGFMVARCHYERIVDEKPDTVFGVDTFRYTTPASKDETKADIIYVKVPFNVADSSAVYERDSLQGIVERLTYENDSLTIALQRTTKHYSDSTYDAWVSGVKPSLDSLKVYRKNILVTTTKYVDRTYKPKFSFGVQGGMGVVFPINHYPTLGGYIGIGGAYNF